LTVPFVILTMTPFIEQIDRRSSGPRACAGPASPGIRAQQSIDAMAVVYTATMLVLLVLALRIVNPTQLVARVKEEVD
jgi:hypothetical protein